MPGMGRGIMTDITALQEQIKQVARSRQEAQRLAEEKTTKLKAWEAENELFLDTVKDAAHYRDEQENQLREMALAVYSETGEKKPAPGVAIREVTRLDYDPKEALKWAMSHQIALSLDKKSFEGFAKATPLEFVQVKTEAQATISQNLEEFIV